MITVMDGVSTPINIKTINSQDKHVALSDKKIKK